MTKKNRKSKDEEQSGLESTEDQAGVTGAASGEHEPESSASGMGADESEVSMDDLLDDVRRSLISEESESQDSNKGWLGKLSKGRRKRKKAAEPPVEAKPAIVEPVEPKEPEAGYVEQIDQLIDMLEDEPVSEPRIEVAAAPEPPTPELPETPPEKTVEPADLDELKKRVFSPSKEEKPEEDFSQVRSVALEGGEEVFVEVEARKEDPMQERVKAFENSLRPYHGMLYFLLAFVGIVMAVVASVALFRTYQSSLPPTPTPVESNLPFPTQLILPGGLSFNLGKGQIVDGSWNPQGPEWLRGTEICRWVAIPWSRPLEAAVRTLTREDTIELVMNNNDRLTYEVFSIQSLTLAEMQELDQNSPCLLVVLAEQDADQRWVVTARP